MTSARPRLSFADSSAIVSAWSRERRAAHALDVARAGGSRRAAHVAIMRRMMTDAEGSALEHVEREAEAMAADGMNARDARRLAIRFAIEGAAAASDHHGAHASRSRPPGYRGQARGDRA